jgi:hypothetical protein
MERAAWTEERLDDLVARVDRGFERLHADIRQLCDQIGTQGVEVRGEIGAQSDELRGEIAALRITMIRVGGAIMAGLVGVIAAVLAAGG